MPTFLLTHWVRDRRRGELDAPEECPELVEDRFEKGGVGRHRDLDAAIAALAASPSSDLIQVQRLKKRKLVLNFSNVEYMSSAALGKFITLNKKVQAAGGRLILCNISPAIYEVFEITKLDKLFVIKGDEEAAIHAACHQMCTAADDGNDAPLAAPKRMLDLPSLHGHGNFHTQLQRGAQYDVG
ncbi:MAG: STAS domain-containing protein [Brachymonas sp.]|nr:STAS domain-containing protein [Brachymonas sp.]